MVSIQDLVNRGLIQKEEGIGFDQIEKHLKRARRDLEVASANLSIDSEASFNYAYLAMLRAGRALMFSFSYRPIDGFQHKTIVDFAGCVLESNFSTLIAKFDRMRKTRNKFTYEEPGLLVTETEAESALQFAKNFVSEVNRFLKEKSQQKKMF